MAEVGIRGICAWGPCARGAVTQIPRSVMGVSVPLPVCQVHEVLLMLWADLYRQDPGGSFIEHRGENVP